MYEAQEVWLTIELLEVVESRTSDPVTLEADGSQVCVSWTDHGVSQLVSRAVELPKEPVWPELPNDSTANPPQF